MTKKLSPQEYYEHAKALFPEITCIRKSHYCESVSAVHAEGSFTLNDHCDWGDLDQWPPKEPERKWRDARMPEDWGKPVQYFFTKKCLDSYEGTLVGYHGDDPSFVVLDKDEMELYWASKVQVEDIPEQAQTHLDNYMLDALRSALNTLDKGLRVRIQDQWPALAAILPETIQKVKDAIERAEADLGAQRQPSSVAKIQAETKAVAKELENVGASEQHQADGDIWQDVYSGQHPADREPHADWQYTKGWDQKDAFVSIQIGQPQQHPAGEDMVMRFIKLRYPSQDHDAILKHIRPSIEKDLEVWQQVTKHPADREPTDEEVERAAEVHRYNHYHIYGNDGNSHREEARQWLKAWQQVWREQK